MKRLAKYIVCLLLLPLFTTTCAVHEWPEPAEAPLKIKLNFRTDLPLFMEIPYSTKATEGSDYDIRYQIRAYHLSDNGTVGETPLASFTYTVPFSENLNFEKEIQIAEGNYRFIVWCDYVKRGSIADLYHNTADFKKIYLQGEHTANTDFRDAFIGEQDFNVVRSGSWVEPEVVYVEMERPLAKFIFITTDLEEFIDRQTEEMLKNQTPGKPGDAPEIKPEDYYVVFKYPIYMAYMFDALQDKPIDSKEGVTFKSQIVPLDAKEASLGFDYYMVNGKESLAQVGLDIYNKENKLLSSVDLVNVRIVRSKHTIVKGKFLTQQASGGVTINPDFNGNHNIFIK